MKTAVVICPGRGTYTKTELGYLKHHFADRALLTAFDRTRAALGQETLSDLDGAASYSVAKHTRGDNASALIYAATLGDFRAIEDVRVVAVTGNSMGWYSALACSGALTAEAGFEVVNRVQTDALRVVSIVTALPGVRRWGLEARRELGAIVRAKGGRRESEFAVRLNRHTQARRALVAFSQADHESDILEA